MKVKKNLLNFRVEKIEKICLHEYHKNFCKCNKSITAKNLIDLSRKFLLIVHRHLHWDFAWARTTFVFVPEFWQMIIDLLITSKRYNLESWNLDSTWKLMNASCVPILGILGHVIVNWDTNKHKKIRFLAWKFINSPLTKKHLAYTAELCIQCGWLYMVHANRVWENPVTWPKCYRPKMGRKWRILNRYISVNTDFDGKWFVIFEHTTSRLSFGYVRLPQPEYYFCSFLSFFLLFFFFFFSDYLLLNR